MNPNFNCAEFDIIKSQAGLNRFRLSAKEWTEKTNAKVSVPATTTTLWGLSYFVGISLWGMYFGAQLVERD